MERWRLEIPPCPPAATARLRRELSVSDALAQALVRRGLGEPARARAFLDADEEHDPGSFEGISAAVASVARHLDEGGRITVHGDYDVDGVCSTALLVTALRRLGGDVDWYLPDRAGDGYGLSAATIRRLAARGTSLLVSVDCGIGAVDEVQAALALGMEVVITDHHTPRGDGVLPRAPVVHPGVCGYPCRDLCATAVAYKLAQALYEARGRDTAELEAELDLVALATIADVVPLLGENRTLAVRGLRRLEGTARPGLRALMDVARVVPGKAGERAVAFALAPRLNAAGRLYRADAALELLLTGDPRRAEQVARELDNANRERQDIERSIRHQAEAQMDELGEREAYVLSGEGWHAGVIGIVASRLVERSGRPVVMVALDGEDGRASGRSIDAFDLLGGLRACSQHLRRFGGHRVAAGMEIARAELAAFSNALCSHARTVLPAGELHAVERVDAVVRVGEVDMALAEELESLAPFGRANPRVTLLVEGATFAGTRPMGQGRHARFNVSAGAAAARAVAFGCDGRLPVADGEPVQATFTLEINEWNGVCEPRLVLRRARAAEQRAAEAAPRRRGEREGQQELALFAV
ncbi:MAG TPA: single-stranded-DNA-specific exonuclease RecJ [Solirubrobacteraceae bacterium]|nr:single-stranded-DNA-specific exonuclease RecJ [Solirubrobacteraceae bacterium]